VIGLLLLAVFGLLFWGVRLSARVSALEAKDADRNHTEASLSARITALAGRVREARPPVEPSRAETSTGPRDQQVEPPAVVAVTPPPVLIPAAHEPESAERPAVEPRASAPWMAARPPRPSSPSGGAPPAKPFDWEELVGVRLFSWAAGVMLAGAAVFFLGYSIQQGWLQPPVRLAIGVLTGLGLLAGCEFRAARRYPVTANALDGSAVVILFSSFFAAYRLWHLLSPPAAFFFLALVTVAAVVVSIRRDSVYIALLGLVGGFSTPALLSTGQDDPLSLFGYLLLLNAGLGWLGCRKRWPVLSALSLVLTTLYQWGWVATFMRADRVPTASAIFLAFPLVGLTILGLAGRAGLVGRDSEDTKDWFEEIAGVGAALPLLFALYLATSHAYGDSPALMFAFLFVVDAGLFAVALWRGHPSLHGLGGLTSLVVAAAWAASEYGGGPARSGAYHAAAWFVAALVAFFLGTGLAARHGTRRLTGTGQLAVFAAPLLLFVFPVFAAAETAAASPAFIFSMLFLLLAACGAYSVAEGHSLVYFIAALLSVTAEAAWSGAHLAAGSLAPALLVYSAFGLLLLAVPIAALRRGKPLEPAWPGSSLALALTSHGLLLPVALQPSLGLPPWPMITALAVIDLAFVASAIDARRGELLAGALGLTQVILTAWMLAAGSSPWPLVAMTAGALVAAAGIVSLRIGLAPLGRGASPAADRGTRIGFFAAGVAPLLLGQMMVLLAGLSSGRPGAPALAVFQVIFVAGLLALAAVSGVFALSVPAAVLAGLAMLCYQAATPGWQPPLVMATPIYLVFLAYPLAIGRRVGRHVTPHLSAVIATAAFFEVARRSLTAGGFGDTIGLLPVAQAGLLGVLLVALLKLEPAGGRTLGRLALVAGAVLALLTVAIPLQVHEAWLTVGWALEAAALAWLYTRIPHRGLFWWAVALLAIVFVRLVLNPDVLIYQTRSEVRIFNWYLYAYLACAAAMFAAARLFSKVRDQIAGWLTGSRLAAIGGTVLLFVLMNIEIADFFATGDHITFNLSAGLAQNLTYTLGWAGFAVALLAAGIALGSHEARVSAILLLTAALLKGFLSDVSRLPGLYRVMSFAGLAVCLALVAVVLQRFVLAPRRTGRQD
jgi:hypothetical protein